MTIPVKKGIRFNPPRYTVLRFDEQPPVDRPEREGFLEKVMRESKPVLDAVQASVLASEPPDSLIASLRRDLKESEKQRYAEIERGDEWRNKFLAVEEELKDLQAAFDRADDAHDRESEVTERKHEIEVRNLKNDINLLNKALEKHAEDEQLTVLLMKKAASFAERMVSE